MRPYYEADGITIYHGDCREFKDRVPVLVSDPPYPNNAGHFEDGIAAAREFLGAWEGREAMIFWSEMERPPCWLPLVAVHIWHRNNVNGRPYEPVSHFAHDGKKRRSCILSLPAVFGGVGPGCWEYLGHPTQKNVDLMRHLIGMLSDETGTILDPFMGTGTTLRAAKDMGRRAIGIEVEEQYCEVAAKRMAQGVLDFGGAA